MGHGANDANDEISLSLSVLDHANPSFSGSSDANVLSLDLGAVPQGSPSPSVGFDLHNLIGTAGFTAGLDLDSVVGVGDTGALFANLTTFGGASTLPANESNTYSGVMDTSQLGAFSATYTLHFSDENLPGAANVGALTLSLSGVVTAAMNSADFDGDSDIDGSDLLTWQRNLGTIGASSDDGDANGDAIVDTGDLAIWSDQFGSPTVWAIPEPSSLALCLVAVAVFWRRGMVGRLARGKMSIV